MPFKHLIQLNPITFIGWRRWPMLGPLALLLLVNPGCSMQKRTTQSGWHIESAVWNQKRSPQTELAPNETPELRLPRELPASSTLPLYTFKRELKQASKRVSETSSLPSTPVEFRPWVVEPLLSDTTNTPLQDSVLSQGVTLSPSANSTADVPSGSDELSPLTLTALITFVLGIGILPAALGALLMTIGVILFLVGRIVKLANKKKFKGRAARIVGNALLIALSGLFGLFATFILLLDEVFGEWTPIEDFFTWLFGG